MITKAKWIKRFKYFAKQAGIKKRELSYWTETAWRENASGRCSPLSAKDAAFQLSRWLGK